MLLKNQIDRDLKRWMQQSFEIFGNTDIFSLLLATGFIIFKYAFA